jgi:hypothetical protein
MSDTPNWSTGYASAYGYFTFYNNEIYFPNNNLILKTNLDGTHTEWVTDLNGGCNSCIVYGDYLYTTNLNGGLVYKISLIDKTIETFVSVVTAQSIVEYGGFFYISGYDTGQISKIKISEPYGPESNLNWASTASPTTSSLAITSEYLYVGFFANNRYICRIKLSDGSVNKTWVQIPEGYPGGLLIHNDYLYATDTYTSDNTNTIYRITLTDTPVITVWKSGIIKDSMGLAYNDNYIYVFSGGSAQTIGKYYLDPNPPPPDPTQDMTNWSTGYSGYFGYFSFYNNKMYFPNDNNILETNLDDGTHTIWANPPGNKCSNCIVYGDYLYSTEFEFDGGSVYKISLADKTIETFINNIYLAQVIVEYEGFFYISQYTGRISKIKISDPYGPESNLEWANTHFGCSPLAITSEYLYVGFVSQNDHYICRINLSDGSVNSTWAELPSGYPGGLVIHDGFLYVTNTYTTDENAIYRVTLTDTPEVTLWKTTGVSQYLFALGYNNGYIYSYTYRYTTSSGRIGKYYLDTPPPPAPPIISDICFPGDTPIETDQGIMYIKDVDATKHTIGNEKIVAITQTISLDEYLVCFEKDALGENCPDKQTLISKNHKIEYKGRMIKAYKFMASFKNVYPVKYNGETLYNVLMENYGTVQINQLSCETLHPSNITAQMYILQKFDNLEELNAIVRKTHKKHDLNKKMKKLVLDSMF